MIYGIMLLLHTPDSPDHVARDLRKVTMAKRVTPVIICEMDHRVKKYRARMMLERNRTYSYSDAVNDLLARDV